MLGSALRKAFVVTRLSDRSPLSLLGQSWATAAGVTVSPERALTASAVYGATTLTADTMASLPIRFLEKDDANRVPVQPPEAQALTGPLANALQTPFDLIQTVLLSMLLWGESFVFPRRLRSGEVFELWPIDPARIVEVERVEGQAGMQGLRFRIDDWDENDGWAENRPGRPVQMIHIPLHVLPGRIRGLSPIAQMAELVGMSLSAQEHAARFLGDGVHMTGTIEVPGELEQDEAKELWENFQRAHAGPRKAGRVGVLTAGAKFTNVTIPPKELEFLEQMKLTDNRIGTTVYRVPPHLMGDVERSTSWGAGIESQTANWVKFRLLSLAMKLEGAFGAALLAGTPYQMRLVMNGLLRGIAKDRAEFYKMLWNMGALSQDEIRAFEDMAPLPDGQGQGYRIPLNTEPIDAEAERLDELSSRVDVLGELLAEGR